MIEITIPYDKTKANGLPPVVVYWDENNKIYRPVAVVNIDKDKGLVTFKAPHFSRFMAIIVDKLGVSMPDVDTGFRMGVDSILHKNFGSYEFGGHCMAFASIATHYFSMKKSKKLYAFAQDGVLQDPLDDELVRSALRYTYALLASKWEDVKNEVLIPSKTDTGLLVLQAMIVTGQPVHFGISSSPTNGHSIVVYGYYSANARFRIYDSNFPKDEVTLNWNNITGFGSYSKAAYYDSSIFDNIGYFSDDTFGESAQFEKIISDWESGALKDYFANLSIKDYNCTTTQNLSFNSDVNIVIPSIDTVTLYGHFTSPVGNNNNKNYLWVMQNGKRLSEAGIAIPASGDFSFNIDGTNATNTEIMLMVSGNEHDPFRGFTAFGKFIVTPRPTILPEGVILTTPGATFCSYFQVVGGTPPYTVYSSDSSAVYNSSPGDGVWTVTTNGGSFIVHTANIAHGDGYLTVTDATGTPGISDTFLTW